jgi:hypothetical protein
VRTLVIPSTSRFTPGAHGHTSSTVMTEIGSGDAHSGDPIYLSIHLEDTRSLILIRLYMRWSQGAHAGVPIFLSIHLEDTRSHILNRLYKIWTQGCALW